MRLPSYFSARSTDISFNKLVATEWGITMVPRYWQYDESVPTVIYCGAFGSGAFNLLGWFAYMELIKRGYAVATSDLDDTPSAWGANNAAGVWGNDTSISRCQDLITWCGAHLKTDTSRIVMMGGSHGGAVAANVTKEIVSDVICLAMSIPGVDLEDVRANNRGGFAASITAALGSPVPDDKNPVEFASDISSVPVYLDYGDTDPICLKSTQLAFAAAHGDTTLVERVAGHSTSGVDWVAMVDWIEALAS